MSNAAFLLKYGSAKHITDVLNNKHGDGYESEDIGHAIDHSPFWNAEHSKKIINDDWHYLNPKALAHHSTTSDMLHNAIDSGDVSLLRQAAIHPNSTEEHHLKMLRSSKEYPITDMFGLHPNLSDKVFEEGAKHPSNLVRMNIADHPRAPDHVIHQLMMDPNEKVAKRAKSEWQLRDLADNHK